jgi:hypothetical protein
MSPDGISARKCGPSECNAASSRLYAAGRSPRMASAMMSRMALAHRDAYRLMVYAKEHGSRVDFVGDS